MIRTDYYVLFENAAPYQDLIDRAYTLIRDNYDIVQDWFEVRGKKGKAMARHFDGRTRTRIKVKNLKYDGRGVPTGMELQKLRMDRLLTAATNTTNGQAVTCLDIDLAAVLLHETHHLCWRSGERTAWSLEAWWRAKVTDRLGLGGATYCNHPVNEFPATGKYGGSLNEIRIKVRDAV